MTTEPGELLVESRAELRGWLLAHHASSTGVWLVTWKTGHEAYLPYNDVVDEAWTRRPGTGPERR